MDESDSKLWQPFQSMEHVTSISNGISNQDILLFQMVSQTSQTLFGRMIALIALNM